MACGALIRFSTLINQTYRVCVQTSRFLKDIYYLLLANSQESSPSLWIDQVLKGIEYEFLNIGGRYIICAVQNKIITFPVSDNCK